MSTFLRPNPRTERDRRSITISLATWNVRGLNAAEKRQQLGRDCAKYHFDLTCLQETKVAVSDDLGLASGHKLVLIQQRTAKYRGLGFVIVPRLKPFVRRWWYVSDRVMSRLGPSHPLSGRYPLSVPSCQCIWTNISASQRESIGE